MPDELPDVNPPVERLPEEPPQPFLHRPALYIALLAFYVLATYWDWLPAPQRLSPRGEEATVHVRSLEDMFREPRELPFPIYAAYLVPLILGSGLLIGYIVLRSHDIRVFPRCEFPLVPWDAMHLVRAFVVFLVVQRLVGAGIVLLQEGNPAWVKAHQGILAVLATNAIMVGMCAFVLLLVGGGGGTPFGLLGLKERRPCNRATIGLAGYLMIFPLLFLASFLMMLLGPLFRIQPQPQDVLSSAVGLSPPWFLVLSLSAVVVAPLTEELLLRGFFYATLRRYIGPLGAIVLSALVFSLLHGYAFGFLALFLIGFLLSYLYERTGSLVASICAHAANNLYSLLVVYLTFHLGSG